MARIGVAAFDKDTHRSLRQAARRMPRPTPEELAAEFRCSKPTVLKWLGRPLSYWRKPRGRWAKK